jgi:hypothetical protein
VLPESLASAPWVVTSQGQVVRDFHHDSLEQVDHWRYVFDRDVVLALGGSWLQRIGRGLEWGPSLSLEATFLNELNPLPLSFQVNAGIELRQSLLRRP